MATASISYLITGECQERMILEKPETVTLVLPLPSGLLSPNYTVGSLGGRFAKSGATKKYRRAAKQAVHDEQIETMPWPKVTVKATFYFRQKRRRDPDNATGSLKAVYDGIVDAGLVSDDDYEHMTRLPPIFAIDRECPRVELIIERVA